MSLPPIHWSPFWNPQLRVCANIMLILKILYFFLWMGYVFLYLLFFLPHIIKSLFPYIKEKVTITSFILIKPVSLRTCSLWYLNWVWANAEAPELLGPPHWWLRLCFLSATLTLPAAGEFSGCAVIKHMGHRDADARTFEKKNEALWRLEQ